jgi:hypothetical protein
MNKLGFALFICLLSAIGGTVRSQSPDPVTITRIALRPPNVDLYFRAFCGGMAVLDAGKLKLSISEVDTKITDYTLTCADKNVSAPSSIALVLDVSASMGSANGMGQSGAELETRMLGLFVTNMDTTIDEAALVLFNDEAVLLQRLTNTRAGLLHPIDSSKCKGGSKLWDGIHAGMTELITHGKGAYKAVIVVADGGDTGSSITPEELLQLAVRNNVRVYLIANGLGSVPTSVKDFSKATGGGYTVSVQDLPWKARNYQMQVRYAFEECVASFVIPCLRDTLRNVTVTLDICGTTATALKTYVSSPGPYIVNVKDTVQICDGDLRVFEAAPGYARYRWSTGDSAQTQVVVQGGTYSVTVTDRSGCTYASMPVTVIQHKARVPTISLTPNKSIICRGDSVELDAGPGFTRYLWCTGQNTQRIFVKDQNRYCVGVADSNGCASTQSVYITVLLPPSIPAISRKDDVLTCDPAAAYQWYRDDVPITGETQQTLLLTKTGKYKVTITNASGCSAASNVFDVVALGVSELFSETTFDLYPDPNNGVVTVQWSMERAGTVHFVVTDILGKQRFADRGFYSTGTNSRRIDLTGMPSGMYFIHILGGADRWVRKIIRE